MCSVPPKKGRGKSEPVLKCGDFTDFADNEHAEAGRLGA